MAINEREAAAGLKVLAFMANADGTMQADERSVIDDAVTTANLPGVTTNSIIGVNHDLDSTLAEITSQEARDATFSAAFALVYADRDCVPAEQAVLDRIEKAFVVPKERESFLKRMFSEARDTVSLSRINPLADPSARQREIDQDVLKYSTLSGVLGLNPIPIASIATDLAVVGIQTKMFRDIGQYWGRETTKDTIKQIMGGLGVGTGARIAVNNLLKFIPGVGSVVAAGTNFASTWALGKVANQYWESGGKADMQMLRELFSKSKAEGKGVYKEHASEIEAKSKANKASLDLLAADYKDGKITQADYERRLSELK